MAKQLYDYWFVQFDFPNEEGKPYKSSGGEMVWNEKLKRFIPKGWESTTLGNECQMYQPKTLGLSELDKSAKYKVYGANGVIGKYHTYNHENSEIAMACRGNSCGTVNRTTPFSWITGNAMVIKMIDDSIHNEYIKQALQYANINGAISGSGQPQLTRENLNSIKLCKPTRELIIRFSEQVSNIIKMFLQNESNIEELTRQRDELLPLLMNGQVSVNSDLSHQACFIPLKSIVDYTSPPSPKNKSSVRKIQIDWQTVMQFAVLMKNLPKEEPLFVKRGYMVYNSTVNDRLEKLCRTHEIPVITIHGLRHTHASLLLFAGVSTLSVARRLGHSSINTTQKTYLHIIQELENKDIDIVMRTLSGL